MFGIVTVVEADTAQALELAAHSKVGSSSGGGAHGTTGNQMRGSDKGARFDRGQLRCVFLHQIRELVQDTSARLSHSTKFVVMVKNPCNGVLSVLAQGSR